MANSENLITQQASALRQSYNMQPGPGLNGGRVQSLTQPQQLDKLLSGMGRVIESASSELQRRESEQPSTPDTLVGFGKAGPNQRARNRSLSKIPLRPSSPQTRMRRGRGKISPSGMPGRRVNINAGRPRGS